MVMDLNSFGGEGEACGTAHLAALACSEYLWRIRRRLDLEKIHFSPSETTA
jgi:hypothetical protein